MKIAVDAMGGDHAPAEVVKGAIEAADQYRIPVILVGDRDRIELELAGQSPDKKLPIEIRHTSQVVGMDEHPANAIRRKSDSSIVVAAELVRCGEAQAVVSAGNTGAFMAVATLRLGRIQGIDRPAIGTIMPRLNGTAVMLDAGANADCDVDNMLQFAIMGSEYAARVLKIHNPRVGLLSIGEEPTKGNELTKATNARLTKTDLNFIGNVEGKDIFRDTVDVIICDGFAGNIVLKVSEGTGEFLLAKLRQEFSRGLISKLAATLLRPAFRRAMSKLDYAEYGGAPLLGVTGVCIVCHGRSSARAIRNAIRAAAAAVENNIVDSISSSLHQKELVG